MEFGYLAPYALEWFNMLVRWLHIITGTAWMGASFYFGCAAHTIRRPAPGSDVAKKGFPGEPWHGPGAGPSTLVSMPTPPM